jgi:DNA-binding winged helix-turn-helix (wHTH) protein
MPSSASSTKIVRFGVFEVDLKASELRKHGLRLKLPEQPFQVLAVLLEKPSKIITRDELRNRLWQGDTFVDFDHGLNNAVMKLREVLGDSSENPRFVETIPRCGYRFIAPVEESVYLSHGAALSEAESVGLRHSGVGPDRVAACVESSCCTGIEGPKDRSYSVGGPGSCCPGGHLDLLLQASRQRRDSGGTPYVADRSCARQSLW